MKTKLLVGLPLAVLFTSCIVPPPPPPPPHHHHHPGPSGPYSPGGHVVLPPDARRTVYRGGVYYVHRDVWYRSDRGGYVIVARPY